MWRVLTAVYEGIVEYDKQETNIHSYSMDDAYETLFPLHFLLIKVCYAHVKH